VFYQTAPAAGQPGSGTGAEIRPPGHSTLSYPNYPLFYQTAPAVGSQIPKLGRKYGHMDIANCLILISHCFTNQLQLRVNQVPELGRKHGRLDTAYKVLSYLATVLPNSSSCGSARLRTLGRKYGRLDTAHCYILLSHCFTKQFQLRVSQVPKLGAEIRPPGHSTLSYPN
jgi:hypothetical protein